MPPSACSPGDGPRFARRIDAIDPSATLALDARAKELEATGADVVNMAVGEPDFPAPPIVRDAACARIQSGRVGYTPAAGTPSLRSALAEHLTATRGGAWSPAEVTVCHSAKHALSGTLFALLDEGDEALVPVPAWTSYFDLVRVTGASPVLVHGPVDASGFHPDPDALRRAVTPRTRLLLVNSPNNPTGSVWTREETEALVGIALEHDLWVVSDEIYRSLVYGGAEATSAASVDGARARTVVVDGASKCLAMTGYRIGYVAGPPAVAAAVAKLHSQTAGSPNTIAQYAYEAALRNPPPETEEMRRTFERRGRRLVAGLRELGLPTPEPRGAFYAFPDVRAHLDGRGCAGFCEDLLEEERLALVPGDAFGAEGHVRLSYALGEARLEEALARLGAFLARRPAYTR